MSEALIMTEAAAAKVYELLEEEGNFSLNLRVSVIGGGCSGLKYNFTFDEEVNEDDTVIAKNINNGKVQLLVDSISFPYLEGSEIDYKEDIEGSQFIIRNPNSKTTCGCGSSFST